MHPHFSGLLMVDWNHPTKKLHTTDPSTNWRSKSWLSHILVHDWRFVATSLATLDYWARTSSRVLRRKHPIISARLGIYPPTSFVATIWLMTSVLCNITFPYWMIVCA